jgi:cytochrome o ubiquinol oxidase subunit III
MNHSFMIHHQDLVERYPDTRVPDPHQDTFSKTTLGFWIYLMTDCLLFATLFITYAVLHNQTFGGPTSRELFSLSTSFVETMILLCSSVACGFAILSAVRNQKNKILAWLFISFLLGAAFIFLELSEFAHLVQEGNSWRRSAFLSSFFTLVSTHGLHVSFGLLWMIVMMGQVFWFGVTVFTFRRLVIFSLFWHFLDLIWIFIFTFVYLMGVI